MTIEQTTYTALAQSAALAAYVAEAGSPSLFRIYPEAAPQSSAFPLVTYSCITEDAVKCLDGSSTLKRSLMQVDCFADSVVTAGAMADAVEAALFGNFAAFKGLKQTRSVYFDEEFRVFVVSQDFAIWA